MHTGCQGARVKLLTEAVSHRAHLNSKLVKSVQNDEHAQIFAAPVYLQHLNNPWRTNGVPAYEFIWALKRPEHKRAYETIQVSALQTGIPRVS